MIQSAKSDTSGSERLEDVLELYFIDLLTIDKWQ